MPALERYMGLDIHIGYDTNWKHHSPTQKMTAILLPCLLRPRLTVESLHGLRNQADTVVNEI